MSAFGLEQLAAIAVPLLLLAAFVTWYVLNLRRTFARGGSAAQHAQRFLQATGYRVVGLEGQSPAQQAEQLVRGAWQQASFVDARTSDFRTELVRLRDGLRYEYVARYRQSASTAHDPDMQASLQRFGGRIELRREGVDALAAGQNPSANTGIVEIGAFRISGVPARRLIWHIRQRALQPPHQLGQGRTQMHAPQRAPHALALGEPSFDQRFELFAADPPAVQAMLHGNPELVQRLLHARYVDVWCDGEAVTASDPFGFIVRDSLTVQPTQSTVLAYQHRTEPHHAMADLLRLAWLASA